MAPDPHTEGTNQTSLKNIDKWSHISLKSDARVDVLRNKKTSNQTAAQSPSASLAPLFSRW